MQKKTLLRILAGVAVVVVVAAALLFIEFRGSAVPAQRELFVSRTATYDQLTDSLLPSIRRHAAFRAYARRLRLADSFKPGHYVLRPGMSVIEIVRMLKLGMQTPVRVTIQNVRTPAQLAQRLSRQLDADSAALMDVLTSPQMAAEVGFDSVTLFSMFIPDTYEFYWTVSPRDFVLRMKREYDRFWTPERDALRQRSGLSRLGVMTLASIVLQADPTVKYALQDFTLRRILHRHLKTPSPYNTYVNRGLPPSPICMPGKSAIEAVLHFEEHDYLYFCARPTFDGYHNFARTLSEHNRNARAYSAELNRRKIK